MSYGFIEESEHPLPSVLHKTPSSPSRDNQPWAKTPWRYFDALESMIIAYERNTLPPAHRRFEARVCELNHALIFVLIEALDTAKHKDTGGWVHRSTTYLDLSKPHAGREMGDQVIEVLVELGFLTYVPDSTLR